MRRGYILDTNQLTHAITHPQSAVRSRLWQSLNKGVTVGVIVPILCEAEAGFVNTKKGEEYRKELRHFLRRMRVWPMDTKTAEEYGRMFRECRAKGRVLSQVDMMIAAHARQFRLVIVSNDKDFSAVPDVPREDWII